MGVWIPGTRYTHGSASIINTALVGIPVLCFPGSTAQVLFTQAVAVATLGICLAIRPFNDPSENGMQTLAQIQIYVSLLAIIQVSLILILTLV